MSLFDLIANDMRAGFHDTPDYTPYAAVQPKQSLDELNPPATGLIGEARKGALASAKMRFDVPDAAPTETLNRILWHNVRGWGTPYPAVKRGAFAIVVSGRCSEFACSSSSRNFFLQSPPPYPRNDPSS